MRQVLIIILVNMIFILFCFAQHFLEAPEYVKSHWKYGLENKNQNYRYISHYNKIPKIRNKSDNLIPLTVHSNSIMAFIHIFSEAGIDTVVTKDSFIYTFYFPEGTYFLFTGNNITKNTTWEIYKDSILLNYPDSIYIDKNEAIHKNIYQFLREDFSPLHINSIYFNYTSLIAGVSSGTIFNGQIDSISFIQYYNKMQPQFRKTWLVKGKQNANKGNIYLLNGITPSESKDSTLINNPNQYAVAYFNYCFPDSVNKLNTGMQIGIQAPIGHWYIDDPEYQFPTMLTVFQDTSASFSLPESKFSQEVNLIKIYRDDMQSAEMRIGDNQVLGYSSPENYSSPFIVSESDQVYLGRTPTFWFGKFYNTKDTIKIIGEYGYLKHNQLFLSQTNDVLKHEPYPIEVLLNDNVIYKRNLISILAENGSPLSTGFDTDSLKFAVSSDSYKVKIKDIHSEVAGKNAITKITATFDLQKEDRNPPYLDYFQILSGKEITNILKPNNDNIIRFKAKDNTGISSARLIISSMDSNFTKELALKKNNNIYSTKFSLFNNGYYSIRLILLDEFSNSLEMVLTPAFRVGELMSIDNKIFVPNKIELLSCYPNPFNSSIQLKYSISSLAKKIVKFTIYDINGREIKTLKSSASEEGIYTQIWNGKNNLGEKVASGIYFVVMKGGDSFISSKIVLIR